MPFKLITPTRVVFDGQAELVIAVTTEGEEGFLAHHAPFLSALKPGVLRANVVEDGATRRLELATSEGFVQSLPDRLTVLVDEALAIDQIDVAAARKELADAQARAADASEPHVIAREAAHAEFASAKLRLTGHHA